MNSNNKINVGIMGFGRIGRDFFRLAQDHPEINIVAISDIGNPEILLYLLKVDGVKGEIMLENNYLVYEQSRTRMIGGKHPTDVPWDALGVDIVIDATHKYVSRDQMQGHIDAGAKRAIVSALPRDEIDRVVVMGVNDNEISADDKLISAASSTTQAFALMLKILGDRFDIVNAIMTTVHAYTSDQPLQDTVGKDFRRSRSAAENIIPNDTPVPAWAEKILPQFAGKLEGLALNVPVPRGSCLDLTLRFSDDTVSTDAINDVVREAAEVMPELVAVTDDPIVSSDVLGSTQSLLFDTKATMRTSGQMAKTLCWYDNGFGHAARIIDIILAYGELDRKGGSI